MLCLLLAAVRSVGAQATPSEKAATQEPAATEAQDQLDQARKLFEEGLAHVEAGNWVAAEQAFRSVLVMRSSPVVAYNLASALARLGRLIESAEMLRAIVRDTDVDAATRDPAEHLLSEIEPRIGSVTVRVLGETEGLLLRLDDRTLSAGDLVQSISVDPGVHIVAAERGGKTLASQEVNVGGAAPLKTEVTLDVREKPKPLPVPDLRVATLPKEQQPAQHTHDDGSSAWSSPWLWSGAAAVVLVTAGVITVLALSGNAEQADPIGGDTNPPVVRGIVVAEGAGP